MKLSDTALKRPVTTVMVILLLVLLGGIAFTRINLDMYPEMTYPGAAIIMEYEGVGPEEIENMVTKPLEGAVSTVTNIESVDSTSSTGQSVIVAQFNWGTDMDVAVMDMREKIDLFRDMLPDEAGDPMIVKFDPSMMAILQLGVSADTDLATLKRVIEDRITPRLERLEGVASVSLTGGQERQILVSVDQTSLNNYQIDYSSVISTLAAENINVSGGSVNRGDNELLVRLTGKFNSIDEIRELSIQSPTGLVKLEEIASVEDTYKEMNSKSRLSGRPSIGLSIQKQTDANTVQVSNLIRDEIDKIENEIDGVEMVPIMDQAEIIQSAVGNVGINAIFGGILAVIILFLFLRNIRSTLIIATAIPVSVITTFMLLYFGDLTLNMMTLGGIALGVGMLVDNSIVVLENIYRYRMEGYGRLEAARKGSQEIGMAIVASTITTIVVFLPVVFVEGLASKLFRELALTVTFSLVASLAVSLTLIPVMASKILKINRDKEKSKGKVFDKIRDFYTGGLKWCLYHRWTVVVITLIVLLGSCSLYYFIGAEFIPEMDQGEFTVEAQLPIGTTLEETDKVSAGIEDIIMDIPEVDSMLANIGTTGDMSGSTQPETAMFYVKLKDFRQRQRSTDEVMEELRNKINIPDTEISVQAMGFMGQGTIMGGSPVSIQVTGDRLDQLETLALQVKEQIGQVEGIREIADSISEGRPELQISINRNLAARMGLRISQIGSAVKTSINGQAATRYEVDGEEYDLRVKLADKSVDTPAEVKELLIPNTSGARVPLSRIAEFKVEQGPKEILRQNQERYVTVTADLYNRELDSVMAEIQDKLDENIILPAGYQIEYGGEYDQMQESFTDLGYAFILALVLVYMVMASQFESLFHPFIVMFTVPMAIIGVMLGLFVTGHNLSIVSIIGITVLAGIVVNNAIVLVDYINTVRERGKNIAEAILEAGSVRLRPIMMTALTTMLGLLPLALGLGEGAETQAPMAVVVIGGLAVATLLTLYVIPVTYSLLADLKYTVIRKKKESTNDKTM